MRLKDKVAIITGAGGAQGRAATVMFCREGAKVVAADIVPETLESAVQAARRNGGAAVPCLCDISNEEQVKALVQFTVRTFGAVNVLYNNAATFTRDSCTDADEQTIDYNLGVNLKGPFFCCKHVIPEMIKAGGGSIINIATGAPFVLLPGGQSVSDVYLMAKWGLRALSRSIAAQFASKNIRSNVIGPGLILQGARSKEFAGHPEVMEQFRPAIPPMNRLGRPEEVVYCAMWLASDESPYCTGADITIDGGMTVSRGATFTGDPGPLFADETTWEGVGA
jgi:NAD(P)-dependent dehydrogenase (short-subunit alcohol dehydrogenase family)